MNSSVLEKMILFYNKQRENEEEYFPDQFLRNVHLDHLESKGIDINFPLFITWNITNSCNLNCFFCSAKAKNCKDYVINESTVNIAKKIVESGCVYVSILGGEPTLDKNLIECIKLFNKNHIFTEIVTNGFGITESFVQELIKLDLNLIRIKLSLDSANPEVNDKIRGKSSFFNIEKAINILNDKKIFVRLQMVVCEKNKDDILKTYMFAQKNKCSSFGFSFVMPVGRAINLQALNIDENIMNQLLKIKEIENQTKLEKFGFGADGFCYFENMYQSNDKENNLDRLKCSACRYRLNVDENGDVYPCDMLRFPEFKLGNILDRNIFKKAFRSRASKKIKKITLRKNKTECKDCKNYWCNSGCFGMCYEHYKETGEFVPICKLNKGD